MEAKILLGVLIVLVLVFVITGRGPAKKNDQAGKQWPSTSSRWMKSCTRKDNDLATRADDMGYFTVLNAQKFDEKPGETFTDWRGNECKWKE